jgi:PIN domain nuclease of toxin-antitoxin system
MWLLLDMHIFLWAVAGSPRLKRATRRFIESAEQVHVSAASIWEVAVKARLGKLEADPDALVATIGAASSSCSCAPCMPPASRSYRRTTKTRSTAC